MDLAKRISYLMDKQQEIGLTYRERLELKRLLIIQMEG